MTEDRAEKLEDEQGASQRQRRKRLLAIRSGVDVATPPPPEAAGPEPADPVLEAPRDDGADLNTFLRELTDKRQQRRHQLNIIHDFFQNPVDFDVDIDVIPSGTSIGDIRDRRKELRYRISLLSSVLEALQGEEAMLMQAEMGALDSADGKTPEQSADEGPAAGDEPSSGESR